MRIEREQHVVARDPVVEAIDELLEEPFTADAVVHAGGGGLGHGANRIPAGVGARTQQGCDARYGPAMSSNSASPWLDPVISAYVAERAQAPDAVLLDLVAETAEATGGASLMQVSAHQGALLGLLVGISGARRAVEVGTFTGYSAICIARALPDDGRLLCCDISDEYTSIAQRAWTRAGLDDRIELRLGPAAETLRRLPPDQLIDFAFLDADKTGYLGYFETLLPLMRPGALICVDNTLWSGRVAEPVGPDTSDDTKALIAFNDSVAADPRVESYVLPIGDGLTLIRKR